MTVTVSILVLALVLSWAQIYRMAYQKRMQRYAISVITEAGYYKKMWPDSYPTYREQAAEAFESHGIGDLIRYLPLVP